MKLWIAGQFLDESGRWNFLGVFDDEGKAKDVCKDPHAWIAPAELNRIAPTEYPWTGQYFPVDGLIPSA